MEDRHGTSRTYEIVGRIGGDFIRAYARPGARMAAAIGHNLLAAWSSRGAIRKKLLRPLNRALGRIMRSPVAKEPMEPATLPADIARLLTELCAAGNRQHARSDRGANPRAGEKIRAFLENMDFGELMDAARAAEPRAYEAIEAFNRELWRYPAKVVSIVATLVALVNTGLGSAARLARPLTTNLGPDLTVDIFLSILRDLKAKEAGILAATLSEIVRRFQTGSLLLSRAGKPLFQIEMSAALESFIGQLDPAVIAKAHIALAEIAESFGNALRESLAAHPEIARAWVESYAAARNPRIRSRAKEASDLASMGPDVFEKALSELDIQTSADIFNTAVRAILSLHAEKPSLLSGLFRTWGYAVDTDALREAAESLVPEIVDALRPAAEAVLPAIIQGLSDLLSSTDDDTLGRFRTALAVVEGGAQ
ncbi:MAG: hypothetical protein WAR22_08325 [Desulfomonilia bacterium]|jgi:hypothetical protein